VVKILSFVKWAVMPCGLVGGYRRFGRTYRLHLQGSNQVHSHNPEDHNRHHVAHFEDGDQNMAAGKNLTELCGMTGSYEV
jgi:hypothetical protein